MDASVTTLSALAVFESTVVTAYPTLPYCAVRSVHGYKVVGRKTGVGWVRWEKWVERGFFLSADRSTELIVPDDAPRILQAWCSGRPAFREGHTVGHWRCIVAFDNVAAVKPSAPPPPMLCPTGNPRLKYLSNLYDDLQKVFQFQSVENLPQLIHSDPEEQQQSIQPGELENVSDEADYVSDSDSDSDEDPQSGEEAELPTVQKYQRASKTHIAGITLVEIAQCFHLPITQASKTLKIGVSKLKKKCREYGIPRWPQRKIKSLDSLIHELEASLDRTRGDAQQEKEKQALAIRAITKRKRMLQREKETIRQKPALDLKAQTKVFREDVFKRRNRIKKSARH